MRPEIDKPLSPLDSLLQSLSDPTPTPWGLTVGQTVGIFVVAAVLLVGWIIVRVVLRLGEILFRIGCVVLVVFICGIISFVAIYNLTNAAAR
jgi:hypothetical protein